MASTALTAAVALSNPAGTSPSKFTMDTADVSDAAALSTNIAGADNDIVWTAVDPGTAGNDITIAYVVPPDNDEAVPASVAVVGTDIEVTLEVDTDGSTILSTADDIKTLVNADPTAGALVQGVDKAANDGSGVMVAMAATPLTGGDTGGNTFTNAATKAVLVRNDHVSDAKTITARDADGSLLTAISLAAAESCVIGPFDPDVYGATVTLEGESTDIKMRLLDIAPTRTAKVGVEFAKSAIDTLWAAAGTSPKDKRALRRVSHKMAVALRRITGVNPAPLQHEE